MNKQTIIIIIRQPLERRPPIINLIDVLITLNKQIILICDNTLNSLREKYRDKVEFVMFRQNNSSNKALKVINWLLFRHKTFKYLDDNAEKLAEAMLWVGSADTALALGKKLIKYDYVFQCQELYDAYPIYQKGLKKIMQNAIININPEDNRGAIFRSWYKLKETPITLPNKPFYHPRQRNLSIDNPDAAQIVESIKDKKILLYQGGIVEQRDVSVVAEAVEQMGEWVLVLLGNTDKSTYLDSLIKKYPKLVYISQIPAPAHLQVTSWARIGLLSYTFDDLNHVFCAPNKTWEYTGFGVPLLGNEVPGVMNDIKKYGSGEYFNFEKCDPNEIIHIIEKIDNDYDRYSQNALNFYESVDVSQIILQIIERITNSN